MKPRSFLTGLLLAFLLSSLLVSYAGAQGLAGPITGASDGQPPTSHKSPTSTPLAPSTATAILLEGAFPPAGWTVSHAPGGASWAGDDAGRRGNLTGGSGGFAIVDDDVVGSNKASDAELRTPPFDFAACTRAWLAYSTDYRHMSSDYADVDVSLDGGATWTNLQHWTEDHRGPLPVQIEVTDYVSGRAGVVFRFHYADGGAWAWWWQIGDVRIVTRSHTGLLLQAASLTAQGCAETAVAHSLSLRNCTGADGSFDLDYAADWPAHGPASLDLAAGASQSFVVPVDIPCDGATDTVTVTASGYGYGESLTLSTSAVGVGWTQMASEPGSGRMDGVVAGFDGYVWSITGYGADDLVRKYDPTSNTWTVVGTPPPFGVNHARSGCKWHNKAFLYGDTVTSGFRGLWEYDMLTGTWTSVTPGGAPPAQAAIWAPAWVADEETGICYLTGGATAPGGGDLSTVYAYDPGRNSWLAQLPSFSTPRDLHAAWLYSRPRDGQELLCVAGGTDGVGRGLATTQCYDFSARAWNAENADLGALPGPWWGAGYQTKLHLGSDQQLWLVAGVKDGAVVGSALYYDVAAARWHEGGSLVTAPVYRPSLARLDNELYLLGGAVDGLDYVGLADHHVQCYPCDIPMWVQSVGLRYQTGTQTYRLVASVRILDYYDELPGATVSAQWTLPDGSTVDQTEVTNSEGQTAFKVKSQLIGTYGLCITGVGKAGHTYDPGQNLVDCSSIAVP